MIVALARFRRLAGPVLILVAALLVAGIFYVRLDQPPRGEPQVLEARIVGFQGLLHKGLMRNIVQGRVELPNGRLAVVRWPDLPSDCRAGDRVQLVRFGNQLKVAMPVRCEPAD